MLRGDDCRRFSTLPEQISSLEKRENASSTTPNRRALNPENTTSAHYRFSRSNQRNLHNGKGSFMDVQLLIFDCDGVLVDSERLSAAVLRTMAAELGVPFTSSEALDFLRGRKVATWVEELSELVPGGVPGHFIEEFRTRAAEMFDAHLRPVPGVEQVLREVRLPHCLASSAPIEKIRHTLRLTGLLPRFEGRMYSAYEVGSWKPEPGLFLHAAQDRGVRPENCVVVEDSLPGVRAGVAAGMTVLGYAPLGSGMDRVLADAGASPFSAMSDLLGILARLQRPGELPEPAPPVAAHAFGILRPLHGTRG